MRVPLTDLSRELMRLTGCEFTYRKLYLMILDGKLPAERIEGSGRYTCDPHAVAAALGLTERVAA
jgi:hypothetical protein